MAIFGWIVCFVIMLKITGVAVAWTAITAGQWSVGGAVNSIGTRLSGLLWLVVVCFGWYLLFDNTPFSVTLK